MNKRFILLLLSSLPAISYQTLGTNTKDCIDVGVHAREISSCCRFEPFCSEEASEKCDRELRTQIAPSSLEFVVCFLDCAYQEMGFLTKTTGIDVQKYITFYAETDNDYQIVISNAVNYCAENQNTIQRDADRIKSKCGAFALLFHECVAQFTLRNCPDDRLGTSGICKDLKMGAPICAS